MFRVGGQIITNPRAFTAGDLFEMFRFVWGVQVRGATYRCRHRVRILSFQLLPSEDSGPDRPMLRTPFTHLARPIYAVDKSCRELLVGLHVSSRRLLVFCERQPARRHSGYDRLRYKYLALGGDDTGGEFVPQVRLLTEAMRPSAACISAEHFVLCRQATEIQGETCVHKRGGISTCALYPTKACMSKLSSAVSFVLSDGVR